MWWSLTDLLVCLRNQTGPHLQWCRLLAIQNSQSQLKQWEAMWSGTHLVTCASRNKLVKLSNHHQLYCAASERERLTSVSFLSTRSQLPSLKRSSLWLDRESSSSLPSDSRRHVWRDRQTHLIKYCTENSSETMHILPKHHFCVALHKGNDLSSHESMF